MSDPADGVARQISGFLNGSKETHHQVDEWIDAALGAGFHSIRSDWEDIRQEVRVRLYRNLSRGAFDGRSSLRTYVHRMARNVAIDSTRRAYRQRETSGVEQLPGRLVVEPRPGPEQVDSRDLLEKILQPFDAEDRLIIALIFEERCTAEEVAARLQAPVGTIKSRVSRLRDKILRRRRQLCAGGR